MQGVERVDDGGQPDALAPGERTLRPIGGEAHRRVDRLRRRDAIGDRGRGLVHDRRQDAGLDLGGVEPRHPRHGGRSDDQRGPGRAARTVRLVVVVAGGRLAPEPAGVGDAPLHLRRPIPRIAEEALEDGDSGGQVHVGADDVGKLERTESKADPAHGGIDRRHVGQAALEHPEGLKVVRALDAVDDEARGVGRDHRRLAHQARQVRDRVGDGRVGHRPGNHLDERHQRHRVEEMHADDACGVRRRRGDARHRQRARVGRQDGVGNRHRVEAAERVALEVEILRDRLDHHLRHRQALEHGRRAEPANRGHQSVIGQLALLHLAGQESADAIHGPIGRAGHRIVEQHLEPCLRGNLGNARAHRAGPEDADRRDLVHRPPNSGSRFSANAATPSA